MTRVVLVTGASGFIGKRLVVSLAQEGWQVRAGARDPEMPDASGIERVAMPDLARPADWSALLEGASHVVHLAGIAHAPGTLPDALYSRVNAESAGELADQARGKVERLVFVSSGGGPAGRPAEHMVNQADDPAPP
ncbi:MAG: NAD-dependent epimerase/dehydratase family protein, partial [Methyloceanibacter sp.]